MKKQPKRRKAREFTIYYSPSFGPQIIPTNQISVGESVKVREVLSRKKK